MSKGIEGAGEVLRFLAERGQMPSADIGAHVGWNRRVAGPRMRALELQGFVKRHTVKAATMRTDARYEWAITLKGREIAGVEGKPGDPGA